MFENHPKINDENNLVPDKTIVIVPHRGISKESIEKIIKPLKGEKKRDFFVDASYFCLPMIIANQYGFVVETTNDIHISWDGKSLLKYEVVGENRDGLRVSNSPQNNVITFTMPFMLRTPPMVNLMVITPPNYLLPMGLSVLSGVVEADNLQFEFTLNLIFQEKGKATIPKGTPISALLPIERHYVDDFKLQYAEDLYDKKVIDFELLSYSQWQHVRETEEVPHYAKTGQRGRRYFKGLDAWNNPFKFKHQK